MPTKLKKPIVLTITHVENAIEAAMLAALPSFVNARHALINTRCQPGETHNQVVAALTAQGIDWRTWEPPQPIYIAGCEADFKSNGDVKLGSETLDRATLLEVLKRSDQAMQKVEEWPKYYLEADGDLFRVNSETHFGTYLRKLADIESSMRPLGMDWVKEKKMKQITRAEAAAILGREV